jgi:CheY-like chemotaxis protein
MGLQARFAVIGLRNSVIGLRNSMANDQSDEIRSGRPRILIVEDERMIAAFIEDLVQDFGCVVSATASTGSSAMQELAKHDFDAVLLDVGLDGERKSDIADLLLETATPFAFITGYDDFEPRHMDVPLLRKPFSTQQFRALLDQLVGLDQSKIGGGG